VIDGQTVWGSDTQDGGWISEDGNTYIDPKGAVQHGISAPDGTFIENGTTRTLPDGTTGYGTELKGGAFATYDGDTLVLPDGTELHGSLDTDTGIFTTSGGDTYFVSSDTGVTHGQFRNADGAFVLDGDNGVVMTPGAWRVDLKTMKEVITTITGRIKVISEAQETLGQQRGFVESAWTSPAGDTFSDVSDQVDQAMAHMGSVLENLVAKLQQTYDNYMETEAQAVKNLTPQA
jgi:WXG100 family type VII secretion target